MKKTSIIAALLSGVLLATAFPPFSRPDIVFAALVPLILAVRSIPPKRAFLAGFLAGGVFWLIDIAWLWSLKDNGGPVALVGLGHIALSLCLALFTAAFAYATSAAWSLAGGKPGPLVTGALALVAEPVFWVGTEYLRGIVLTGFPWNPLAASQYANPALLHAASWAGAGAVSFVIVAVNSSAASLLHRIWRDIASRNTRPQASGNDGEMPRRPRLRVRSLELFLALSLAVFCWMRGLDALRDGTSAHGWERVSVRAAIVQADMPSIFENNEDSSAAACEMLIAHTSLAQMAAPDICVWPETILPGYIPYDKDAANVVRKAVSALEGTPLLAGGIELVRDKESTDIYNSAFLFGDSGIIAAYRKRHLVPFGEFIPLESKLPFLKRLAPAGFSCTAGADAAVFGQDLTPTGCGIGTLICFEDAFPALARQSALNGAGIFATLANDSWFNGSSEGEQHLAQAVLRCVENARPMLRSTNRGVSAFIDSHGRLIRRIGGDGQGAGFAVGDVTPGTRLTPYTRYGDWLLGIPCAIALATMLAVALFHPPRGE